MVVVVVLGRWVVRLDYILLIKASGKWNAHHSHAHWELVEINDTSPSNKSLRYLDWPSKD